MKTMTKSRPKRIENGKDGRKEENETLLLGSHLSSSSLLALLRVRTRQRSWLEKAEAEDRRRARSRPSTRGAIGV